MTSDSGWIPPAGTYLLARLPAGGHPYHCRLHPIMRGLLIVVENGEALAAGMTDFSASVASPPFRGIGPPAPVVRAGTPRNGPYPQTLRE